LNLGGMVVKIGIMKKNQNNTTTKPTEKMPDIAKCMGTGCPYKESCYRYTAKPNEYRQSYFMEPPIKDGKCEMYWGENQLKDIMK